MFVIVLGIIKGGK